MDPDIPQTCESVARVLPSFTPLKHGNLSVVMLKKGICFSKTNILEFLSMMHAAMGGPHLETFPEQN